MLDNFWSLPTNSETLLMKLIDRAADHAVIAAQVLARLCILLRLMRYDMVTRVGWTEAADAKALVHRGRAATGSLSPHFLFDFFGHEPNLFDIAVNLLATLKHGLIRRASRDTSGAAVASVGRLSVYLDRPIWIHLRDCSFFSTVGQLTFWQRLVHETILLWRPQEFYRFLSVT